MNVRSAADHRIGCVLKNRDVLANPAIHILIACLVWGASHLAAGVRPAFGDPSPSTKSLVVLPDPQITLPSPNHGDYGFGWASPIDTPVAEHTFSIRNTGSFPITISEMITSCHCTNVQFAPSAGGVAPPSGGSSPILRTGQQIAIRMTVQLTGGEPGLFNKQVYIDVQGDTQPAAVLEFTGTLAPTMSFTPSTLNFGTVDIGTPRTLTLAVTYDARFGQAGRLPILTCSNSEVRIIALGKPVAWLRRQAEPSDGPTIMTQTYTVTLVAAHTGQTTGIITFAPIKTATTRDARVSDMAATALRNSSVSFFGHVGSAGVRPQFGFHDRATQN